MHYSPSLGSSFKSYKEPCIRCKIRARHEISGNATFARAIKLVEEVCGHCKREKSEVLHTEEMCRHVTMLAQVWEVLDGFFFASRCFVLYGLY